MMSSDTTVLRKQQKTQRITLEIDVVGDEIDSEQCEKIADSFTDFVKLLWCLSDPLFEFAISSTVSVRAIRWLVNHGIQSVHN